MEAMKTSAIAGVATGVLGLGLFMMLHTDKETVEDGQPEE